MNKLQPKKTNLSLPLIHQSSSTSARPQDMSSSRMEILTDPSMLFPFRFPSFKTNHSVSSPTINPSKFLSPKNRSSVATNQETPNFGMKTSMTEEEDPIDEYLKSELQEENSLRQMQVINVMKEFNKLRIRNKELNPTQLKKQQLNLRENIIALAEKVLSLYNITHLYITFPKIDSLLKLDTMNDRTSLAQLYRAVIPELCKFPYSFFKRLGLVNLTFADNCVVYKTSDPAMAQRKILRGVFPLAKLPEKEERILHFYKIILFLMKKRCPDFDQEWVRITPKPKNPNSVFGVKVAEKPRNLFQEQVEVFRAFLQDPDDFLQSVIEYKKFQGLKFKEVMEMIDPVGINNIWWKEVAVYSKIEAEVFTSPDKIK